MIDPDGNFAFLAALVYVVPIFSSIAVAFMAYVPQIINEVSMIVSNFGPQLIGAAQNLSDKISGNSGSSSNSSSSNNGGNNKKPKKNNTSNNKNNLNSQQLNQYKSKVLEGKDVHFKSKEQAIDFVKKKFPEFPEEVAKSRSSQGWHFDSHSIRGSANPIEHINIYSKSSGFRVHITWD